MTRDPEAAESMSRTTSFIIGSPLQMKFYLFFLAITVGAHATDQVLEPVKNGTNQVALVMMQGAQISPNQYVSLMRTVQEASEYTVWVGLPEFTLDIAEPLEIGKAIDRILHTMNSRGMKASSIFVAGHSIAGAVIQNYVYSNPQQFRGQILMGSYIERKYYNHTYPVHTLTIGGELDGLCRITRIMEAYYHYILHPTHDKENAEINFPVLMVKGMNHMQFASGDPPFLVKDRDLKPEITEKDAHAMVSTLIAAFLAVHLDSSHQTILKDQLKLTADFFEPLITAYEMEGFYNFKPPCYDNPHTPACITGCEWTETAQAMMGGLPTQQIDDVDEFHQITHTFHLPQIKNNCTLDQKDCVLHTLTISQNTYELIDELDTGFVATSAHEIRAKLSSRQAILQAAGYKSVDFNKTDGGSICRTINEAAYAWAKQHSNSNTLNRFAKLGEPLIFGEDKGPYNAGPLWIYSSLEYKKSKDSAGNEVIEIQSPMLRTPTDFYIKLSAGFHYCKLLSPARAIEWIYVDGLRLHDSLNNATLV